MSRLCGWESVVGVFPMEAIVDQVGRIVLPKRLRDSWA